MREISFLASSLNVCPAPASGAPSSDGAVGGERLRPPVPGGSQHAQAARTPGLLCSPRCNWGVEPGWGGPLEVPKPAPGSPSAVPSAGSTLTAVTRERVLPVGDEHTGPGFVCASRTHREGSSCVSKMFSCLPGAAQSIEMERWDPPRGKGPDQTQSWLEGALPNLLPGGADLQF